MDCPKCGSKMDLAESNEGLDIRRRFLICSRFPECDGRTERIRRNPDAAPPPRTITPASKTNRRMNIDLSEHRNLIVIGAIVILLISLVAIRAKSNREPEVNNPIPATVEISTQTPEISKPPTPLPLPSPTFVPIIQIQPSAICRDGTYSYSQSRRGTCSHHGGVAQWIVPGSLKGPEISAVVESSAQVVNIVDGDTIDVVIDGVEERIRLLGVDTPETSSKNKADEYLGITDTDCLDDWGDKATEFALQTLSIGSAITLKFDGEKEKDRYDRLLAYVHLQNGTDFNMLLVKNGLARVYEEGSSSRESGYLELQRVAIDSNIGLWQCALN